MAPLATFYFDASAERRRAFSKVHPSALPTVAFAAVGTLEEADAALLEQRFARYLINVEAGERASAELIYHILTVHPDARILLASSTPHHPELRALAHQLKLPTPLAQPFTAETLRATVGWRTDTSEGFSGNLDISLCELIQLFCRTRDVTALRINVEHDHGMIYFEGREIVHCVTSHLQGETALRTILSWKSGQFSELRGIKPMVRSIHQRWEHVLLEAAQMADEQAASAA